MTEIQKLVKDALRVCDLPLNVQEGFMTLIIQQAVMIGHLQSVAALQARMAGTEAQPLKSAGSAYDLSSRTAEINAVNRAGHR